MKHSNKQASKTGSGTKQRKVFDSHGSEYELTAKLAEGGQGVVCRTKYDNVLIKLSKHTAEHPASISWFRHIQWISRLPLDGLKIARPLALVEKPRHGYVMELMDGLEPLAVQLEKTLGDGSPATFIETGGQNRRLKILTSLATTLAELHGRGLAYGDLAPANIFVSRSLEHAEVWLIDCDNISQLSREGAQKIYTPDYGAPEIIRGESGINSLTDSWSFAVIAFQLLTLQHPFKGLLVQDGEPELEEQALRGELPWIDDPDDDSNQAESGIPREWVLTRELQNLFQQCFGAGRDDPGARPSLASWRAAFEAAVARQMYCKSGDGCGSSFYISKERQCPFCDAIEPEQSHLPLIHYLYAPEVLEDETGKKNPWLKTGYLQVLGSERVALRSSPVGTATYGESELICSLSLDTKGLLIEPAPGKKVVLQRQGDKEPQSMRLKETSRRGDEYALHLGDLEASHYVWRFKW